MPINPCRFLQGFVVIIATNSDRISGIGVEIAVILKLMKAVTNNADIQKILL